jgi:hypothetical protein
MSMRINITIPDDLNDRLKHVKDRFNVSKICTKAIDHAVKIEEIKLSDHPDLEKLALKLKEEMVADKSKNENEGFKDGAKDALEFSLQDFKGILHSLHSQDIYRIDEYPEDSIEVFEEIFLDLASEKTQFKFELTPSIDSSYEVGWVKGVLHVWGQVSKKINEERRVKDEK